MENQSKAIRKALPAGQDVDAIALGRTPDAVIGGPPCQGISAMGRRDPNDPRNKLMDSFVEHGIDLGVGYMLMEQVPTLLQPQNAEHLDHLRELLFRAGYSMVERSEEHTSELQSLMRISYAVFCLKNKNK